MVGIGRDEAGAPGLWGAPAPGSLSDFAMNLRGACPHAVLRRFRHWRNCRMVGRGVESNWNLAALSGLRKN